jgi:hypothetical protein
MPNKANPKASSSGIPFPVPEPKFVWSLPTIQTPPFSLGDVSKSDPMEIDDVYYMEIDVYIVVQ